MSSVISHSGIVDSIVGDVVHVRIVQNSACSSCKVASYCNASESKEKIIDVKCPDAVQYAIGDNVEVLAQPSVGAKAVVVAFVIPVILIMTTIIACLAAGVSEALAAVAGIAVMVPYYLAVYLMRGRLERELTFSLRKR